MARLPSGESVIVFLDLDALRPLGVLDWLALSRLGEETRVPCLRRADGLRRAERLAPGAHRLPSRRQFLPGARPLRLAGAGSLRQLPGRLLLQHVLPGHREPARAANFVLPASPGRHGAGGEPRAPRPLSCCSSAVPPSATSLRRRLRCGLWFPPASFAGSERLPRHAPVRQSAFGKRAPAFAAFPAADGLQLRLEVTCRSPQQAGALLDQLRGLTETLREMIAREGHRPNPRDLSGVLTAGVSRAARPAGDCRLARWGGPSWSRWPRAALEAAPPAPGEQPVSGVLCCGNIVFDVLVRPVSELRWNTTHWVESVRHTMGGNGANTAYAAAILGARVKLLGWVGNDPAGAMLLEKLAGAGVDVSAVRRSSAPTAATVSLVNPQGDRFLLHSPG